MKKKKSSASKVSRSDFETFKFGVQRLKELEKELNRLDTRGFSAEERAIRSKLKNVSMIPQIEKELRELKLKINRKFKPKRRSMPTREMIKKEHQEIAQDIERIKGKFPEIKKELIDIKQAVRKNKRRTGAVDSGIEELVDVDFNVFLKDLKVKLSQRVKEKEGEIDDKMKLDLAKRDQKFKERYDNLISEFNERKRKLEKELQLKYNRDMKEQLAKEVKENFDDKLKEKFDQEKAKLGRQYVGKLKEHAREELEIQKNILEKRLREELSQRAKALEKEFGIKKKEEERVLAMKLAEEERKLNLMKKREEELLNAKKRREEEIFMALKKREQFKINMLEKKDKEKAEVMRKKLMAEREAEAMKKKELQKIKSLDIKGQKDRDMIDSQREQLMKEKHNFVLQKSKEIEMLKKKEMQKIKSLDIKGQKDRDMIDSQREQLMKEKHNFVLQKERERKRIHDKLMADFNKQLEKELAARESKLRQELKNDYDLKLKKHIQDHEDELKKRKLNLELEFQKRIKQVLE